MYVMAKENDENIDYKIVKRRLGWTFSSELIIENKRILSLPFPVKIDDHTSNWTISLINPEGWTSSSHVCYPIQVHEPSHVSLYVNITADKDWKKTTKIHFGASVKSKEGFLKCKISLQEEELASEWNKGSLGFEYFCDPDDLKDYFVGGKLTIVIDATISMEKEDCQNKRIRKYEKEYVRNLQELFKITSFSDLVVFCGDQKFLCQKVILAARSTVWKEMLENDQEGKIGAELEITDTSPDVFKVVINHINTGDIPENIEKIGSELLQQATKYNLRELAQACEISLLSGLCFENALSTLITIDAYGKDLTIRKDILKYIARFMIKIMATQEWESFAKDHLMLMNEIIEFVCLARSEEESEDLFTITNEGILPGETIMFQKQVFLSQKDDKSGEWVALGDVDFRILYDDDVFGARIVAEVPSGTEEEDTLVCNHLIAMQTILSDDLIWTALDFISDPPISRTFKAQFKDEEATSEFRDMFAEGKDLAEQSEILEWPGGIKEDQ